MIKKLLLLSIFLTSITTTGHSNKFDAANQEEILNRTILEKDIRAYKTRHHQKSKCLLGKESSSMNNAALGFAQKLANDYYIQEVYEGGASGEIDQQGISERLKNVPGSKKIEIVASVSADTIENAAKLIVKQWANSSILLSKYDHFGFGVVSTDLIPKTGMPRWFAVGIFSLDDKPSKNGPYPKKHSSPKHNKYPKKHSTPISNAPIQISQDISFANGCKEYDAILTKAVQQYISPENTMPQSANGDIDPAIHQQAFDFAKELAENFYFHQTGKGTKSDRLAGAVLSHIGFEERAAAFRGRAKSEILACVTASTPEEAARQIVQNWYNSPGHKVHMMAYQDRYSYVLVKTPPIPGFSGSQWFGVALFAQD